MLGGGGFLGELTGRIVLDVSQAVNAYSQVRNAHLQVITDTRQLGVAFQQAGQQMIRTGTSVLGALGKAANVAAEFNKRMDYFQAVTTSSDKEMQSLRDSTIEWAQNSIYKTGEIADAIVELGKAGVNATTITGGLGQAMVNLGQAADIGLTEASQIMISTMSQFDLGADQAVAMADRLSGAANASIIDIKDLGVTLKYAGGIAHQLGGNFDDLTTAIALLGNAGIKGSMAGTSLRQMMVSLVGQTKPAQKVLKELGIITEDGTNKFFDMNGSLKPLPEVFQVLQDSMKGYSDAQKTSYLRTIFNNRALTAAAILTKEGADAFAEMAGEIEKTSAADVAAERMDNLAGDLKRLESTVEAFLLKAGTPFQNFLRGIVKSVIAVVQAFTSLPDGVQTAILWIIAIGGALTVLSGIFLLTVGTMLNAVNMFFRLKDGMVLLRGAMAGFRGGMMARMFGAMATGSANLGRALLLTAGGFARAAVAAWGFTAALLANPITWIVLAIVALVAAFVLLYKNSEAFRDLISGVWDVLSSGAKAVWDWVTKLPEVFGRLWDSIGGAKGALSIIFPLYGVFRLLKKILPSIPGLLGDAFGAIGESLSNLAGGIASGLSKLPQALGHAIGFIAGWLVRLPIEALTAGLKFATFLMNGFASLLPKLASWAGRAIGFILGFLVRIQIEAVKGIAKFGISIVTGLGKLLVQLFEWSIQAGQAAIQWLVGLPALAATLIQQFAGFIMSTITSLISWVGTMAPRIGSGLMDVIIKLPGQVWGIISKLPGLFLNIVGSMASAARSVAVSAFNAFKGVITGLPGLVWDAITGAIEAFKSMVKAAWNAAKEFAKGLWEGFKKGLGINSPSYIEEALWAITDTADTETKRLARQVVSIQKVANKISDISVSPDIDLTGYQDLAAAMKSTDTASAKLQVDALLTPAPSPLVPSEPAVTKEVTNNWAPTINNPEPEPASQSLFRTAQKVAYLGLNEEDEG